jgi:hypothetical protein
MRRVRRLDICDYIVPIGQKIGQLFTQSNQSNVTLERSWHSNKPDISANLHAVFESNNFDGFKIIAWISTSDLAVSGFLDVFKVYSVNINTWEKTLVVTKAAVQSGISFVCNVTASDLGSNEYTGAEVYFIEASITRRKKSYYVGKYFNHLGIYDSWFRLKQDVDFLDITKLDE